MSCLSDLWSRYNAEFEAALRNLYADCGGEPQKLLFDAMNYSLQAGGKRLRPFLVRQFCEACGGTAQQALPAALAVEMIHTYSLIHDDLPAMDNDDYRRGKLTNHKVYGEAMAILAGDSLLTDAFRILTLAPLPPERIVACVRSLSENAGSLGMAGGQVLDMNADSRPCTEQEVLDIQSRKTGCLIRTACEMGVFCAGGSEEALNSARSYADHLGLAFQIRDDVLDVIGDSQKLGKAVGVDGAKNTFVKLYGLERCMELVEDHTRQAISAVCVLDEPEILTELARYLCRRDR